jgi:hypothetical protein
MGEEVAAFPEEHLIEQRLDLGNRDGLALLQLLEQPAGGRLRHDGACLGVDERRADVAEVEGVANTGAHPAQDLGVGRLPGDARRHRKQLLERALVPRRLCGLACCLDGKRRVVDERDEHLEFVVRRSPAADRLVHRDDPEQEAALVAHRDEERVLGIPGVGVARAASCRHVARPERVPVDGTTQHDVGTAPLEALGEEHRPVLAGPRVPEQHRLRLLVPVHRRHLEVVPLGPVEVDRDGSVAERLADGPGDGIEQRRKILTRPQKTGYLDEAPQR